MPQKKKPNNNQKTLSQSLFRRKFNKRESNHTDRNSSSALNEIHSKSQPEASDFDDSFDLFVPRKKFPAKCSSSQPSNPESDRSKYFSDSGELKIPKVVKDDDVELALAISLQESKGIVVSLKEPKAGPTALMPRGEQRRNEPRRNAESILMQRTPAIRDKIIAEKVAGILAKKNEPPPSQSGSDDYFVYSAFLKKYVDRSQTRWTLSQANLATVSSYIVQALLKFENLENNPDMSPRDQEDATSLQRVSSSEDLFGHSSDGSVQLPSPKRLCQNEIEDCKFEIAAMDSPENIGGDRLLESVEASDEEVANTGAHKRAQTAVGASQEDLKVHEFPFTGLLVEKNDFKSSETGVSNQSTMIRHYEQLSSDLSTLATFSSSEVWEIKIGPNKLFVHGCILRARCPSLAEALGKCPECLNHYSLDTCRALLLYINSADVLTAKQLKGSGKEELLQCALNYNLNLLVEELLNNDPTTVTDDSKTCPITSPQVNTSHDQVSAETRKYSPGVVDAEVNRTPGHTSGVILVSDCSDIEGPLGRTKIPLSAHILSEDDELDLYLKKGVRLSDKKPYVVQRSQNTGETATQCNTACVSSTPNAIFQSPKLIHDRFSEIALPVPGDIAISPHRDVHVQRFSAKTFDDVEELSPNVAPKSIANAQGKKKSTDRFLEDSFLLPDGLSTVLDSQRSTVGESRSCNVSPEPSTSSYDRSPIVNCLTPGRQLIVSEQATPLRNYNDMVTPELKKELERFGIKQGIGRKKAVTLLQYIYDQIHPPANHPAVTKAINEVTKSNKVSTETSDGSDDIAHSLSSASSSEDEQIMFEDMGDTVSSQCQKTNANSYQQNIGLLEKIGDFIKSNSQLYTAILKYEPISLNKFHKAMKNVGVKCNKDELMNAMDELGITFRTERTERRLQSMRTRRPRMQKQ